MTVYADVLFFMNFFMNYLVISICGAFAAGKVKHIRKIIASVSGGIYGVCVFAGELDFLWSVIVNAGASACIVAVVFLPCRAREYFKYLGVFYLSSFLLAGGIYMILPYVGGGIVRNGVIYYNGMKITVIATLLTAGVIQGIRYIKSLSKKREYTVKIRYKDKTARVNGILDTGNLLTDPETGKTVAVGDEEILKKLFSPECNIFNMSEWIDCRDIRLVPYKTLDNNGVMTGILIDEMEIDGETVTDVIVAVSPKKISDGILINRVSL